jgi:hypothetical protein
VQILSSSAVKVKKGLVTDEASIKRDQICSTIHLHRVTSAGTGAYNIKLFVFGLIMPAVQLGRVKDSTLARRSLEKKPLRIPYNFVQFDST